jgi:hypothetical protein
MPRVHINHAPKIEEGEYAGVLSKVSSGFTQKTNELRFTYDIKMKDGRTIKDALYFNEKVSWRIEQLCKSANLIMPENGDFVLTTDDLENRVVHFSVKHNPGENGRVYQNINFHTLSYAIQQNPALAGAYPPQAPIQLRAAPPEEPQPENGGTATPPSPAPSASVNGPGVEEAEDAALSPQEFAEALEQAKKNRAAKWEKQVA